MAVTRRWTLSLRQRRRHRRTAKFSSSGNRTRTITSTRPSFETSSETVRCPCSLFLQKERAHETTPRSQRPPGQPARPAPPNPPDHTARRLDLYLCRRLCPPLARFPLRLGALDPLRHSERYAASLGVGDRGTDGLGGSHHQFYDGQSRSFVLHNSERTLLQWRQDCT